MTLGISVYEKRGLCRGPEITDAQFRSGNWPCKATGGGPLGDGTYRVEPPYYVTAGNGEKYPNAWELTVEAPNYHLHRFWVNDGETHDVWLFRRDS
jgi:hypothetical protein